jgi:hypothetical protein
MKCTVNGNLNAITTPTETKFTCVSLISIRVFLASPIFFMSISPGVEVPSGVMAPNGVFIHTLMDIKLTQVNFVSVGVVIANYKRECLYYLSLLLLLENVIK